MQDNGDRQYRTIYVEDCELPEGTDFAFVEVGGEVWLAYKRNRVTPRVLEELRAVYRQTA